MSILTFNEFIATAKKGDIFQYFAENETDFKHNETIHQGQGKRCVVHKKYSSNGSLYWHFEEDNPEGLLWAFYKSNMADRDATYRILEPAAPTFNELMNPEDSLAVKAVKEAAVALKAKLEQKGFYGDKPSWMDQEYLNFVATSFWKS